MLPRIPKRVLVVRLGAIGDVCNALVFASALRDARPDVEIGWAVHDLAHPLVAGHPAVTRVHLWKRSSGIGGLRPLVRQLREERYELAVDLQRIQKSALLARLSGAPRVLGYDRARTKEMSWIWTNERIAPGDGGAHMVEQYLDVASHLGAERKVRRTLPEAHEAERRAQQLVARYGQLVMVNVGASKPQNRWAPERFGELATHIVREFDTTVCLTGSPAEKELASRALGAAQLEGEARQRIVDLVGETSLPELWSVAARARAFVGCDTGPMHLAAAVGTPVVALFGPASPRRTGPYGDGHRVVRAPEAGAPQARMEDITVELVVEHLRDCVSEHERQASGTS